MALQLTDYLPVNRDDAGTVTAYKTQVQDIVGLVPGAATPNLDEVTTEGGTTTNNISVGQLESTSIGCSGGITSDITVTAGAGDTLIQLNGTSGEISGGALAFIDGGAQDLGGGEVDYPA